MIVTANLLYTNVRRLDNRIASDRESIGTIENTLSDIEKEVSEVNQTALVPPPTTFAEGDFAVYRDGDTTTQIQFDLALFSGGAQHDLAFPDMGGVVVLTTGAQNVSDKNIDESNTIAKGALPGDVVYETGSQTISDKTIDNTNSVANGALSNEVIVRVNDFWSSDRIMSNNEGFNRIRLIASDILGGMDPINKFFVFESIGGSSAGITLGRFDDPYYHMWASGTGMHISRTTTLPPETGATSPGTPIVSVTADGLRLHRTLANWGEFDTTQLTAGRQYILPDESGTLALVGGAGSSSFSDALFTIYNDADNDKQAKVDASAITSGQTRTYGLPNLSGELFLRETIISWNRESAKFTTTIDRSITSGVVSNFQWNGIIFDFSNNRHFDWFDYVVPRTGLYSGTIQIQWTTNGGGGERTAMLRIFRSTSYIITACMDKQFPLNNIPTTSHCNFNVIQLNAGDRIIPQIRQSSGDDLIVESGQDNTYFSIFFHGPST